MKYMLLMHSDPAQWIATSESGRDAILHKHDVLRNELTASGELINGAGLDDPAKTKTLRWQGGATESTDGPKTESETPLTAYYVVDCESLEAALQIAERTLDFHVVAVEVREIHDSVGFEGSSGSRA